jgi:hypothetical protein
MIEEQSQSSNASEFEIPETSHAQFYAKMRLYREAMVLMLMLLIATAGQILNTGML